MAWDGGEEAWTSMKLEVDEDGCSKGCRRVVADQV